MHSRQDEPPSARDPRPEPRAAAAPNGEPLVARARRRAIGYGAAALSTAALYPLAAWLYPGSSSPVHTLFEVVATAVALFVGSLSLVRYYARKSDEFLVLGAGFIGIALLDCYHALVTSAFVAPQLPSGLPSLIPWSWFASRLLAALVFSAAWSTPRGGRALAERAVYLTVAGVSAVSFLFFALVPLPVGYAAGAWVARPEDLVPGALFAAALVRQLRRGAWRGELFDHWLVLSLIASSGGQLVFMPFSAALFDTAFDVAHGLKIASYGAVLVGLLCSTLDAFRLAQLTNQELEQQVGARTSRLERSNRDLDDFAFVASHDLKAPLRDVDNLAKWIAEDAAAILPAESARHFAKIQDRVGRMERLLDDLLQYSRAGRKFGAPEEVRAAELLQSVCALAEAPPGFELRAAAELETLYTPRSALERVLLNLVINAIRHHDRSGGLVQIGVRPRGEFAEFEVRDDGPGIEAKYHERIFGMFQSLKRDEKSQGTGMGLAIVKRLVESHGGRIELDSAPGSGSAFRFTWPLRWSRSAEDEDKL